MEARSATAERAARPARRPAWLLGLVPLLLIVGGGRRVRRARRARPRRAAGPPVEELAVERTVLEPGAIELTVRNDGPDAVTIAQVQVNDAFVALQRRRRRRSAASATATLRIQQPWIEGEAYEVALLTSTGGDDRPRDRRSRSRRPTPTSSFFGADGAARASTSASSRSRSGCCGCRGCAASRRRWLRVRDGAHRRPARLPRDRRDARGLELAGEGSQAFGGAALVLHRRRGRVPRADAASARGWPRAAARRARRAPRAAHARAARRRSASACTTSARALAIGVRLRRPGALALGAFLVVGFALHNTTEGLAIVAPIARDAPSLGRLARARAGRGRARGARRLDRRRGVQRRVAAFLFGVGAGAIVQVIVQLAPSAARRRRAHACMPRASAACWPAWR